MIEIIMYENANKWIQYFWLENDEMVKNNRKNMRKMREDWWRHDIRYHITMIRCGDMDLGNTVNRASRMTHMGALLPSNHNLYNYTWLQKLLVCIHDNIKSETYSLICIILYKIGYIIINNDQNLKLWFEIPCNIWLSLFHVELLGNIPIGRNTGLW